jgi:RHS repeat-associated protein
MKRLLLIVFFVCSSGILLIAQNAEFKIPPINKFKSVTGLTSTEGHDLNTLLNSVGANGTCEIEIIDIQTLGSYKDLSYNLFVKFIYDNSDVTKPALLQPVSIQNLTLELTSSNNSIMFRYGSLNLDTEIDESVMAVNVGPNNKSPDDLTSLSKAKISFPSNELIYLDDAILSSLKVEFYIEIVRYEMDNITNLNPSFYTSNSNNSLKENEAIFKWNEQKKPSYYEVEWIHLPYMNPNNVNGSIAYDFTKDARRVQTEKNFFPITLLFEPGFVVARVRSIRPALNIDQTAITNNLIYGAWSIPTHGQIPVVGSDEVIKITNSINNLNNINWDHSTFYSTNGKKRELINFYDGSLQNRQTVSVLSDFEKSTSISSTEAVEYKSTVLAQESYYDYNGEAVMQMMGSPLVNSTTLGYQPNINLKGTGKVEKVDRDDFDNVLSPTGPLLFDKNSAGVAQYYSDNNPLIGSINETFADFIPDAGQYPYSKTEYLKDGSGRVKAQINPGEVYASDLSRNIQSAYSKPTASELEVLFGSNVGFTKFYKKNVTIDGNGLMNMSYIDQSDRVIATSIAGMALARSEMINLADPGLQFRENLMSTGAQTFNASDQSLELMYSVFVPEAAIYKFEYSFDLEAFDPCSDDLLCFDCRYEYTFKIIDDDGKLILESKTDPLEFSDNCGNNSFKMDNTVYVNSGYSSGTTITGDNTNGYKVEIQFQAKKNYTLIKKLKLKTDQLNADAQQYIDGTSCPLNNENYFQKIELDNANFPACTYDFSDKDPCYFVRRELLKDFQYPGGFFVQGAQPTDEIAPFIYSKLSTVLGCTELDLYTKFENDFVFNYPNNQPSMTFTGYGNELANYFMQYHPSICKLNVCRELKSDASMEFDRALEKIETLDEFNNTIGSPNNLLIFSNNPYDANGSDITAKINNSISTTWNNFPSAFSLFEFDPTVPLFDDQTVSSVYYYDKLFHRNRKPPSFPNKYPTTSSTIKSSVAFHNFKEGYFSHYNGFDPNSNNGLTSSIDEMAYLVDRDANDIPDVDDDGVFRMYKTLYLSARREFIKDAINLAVCQADPELNEFFLYGNYCFEVEFHPAAFDINNAFNYYTNPFYVGEDMTNPNQQIVNSLPGGGATGVGIFVNNSIAAARGQLAKDIFDLLQANETTVGDVNINFIANFIPDDFLCDPFNYILNSGDIASNSINPYLINFSAFTKNYIKGFYNVTPPFYPSCTSLYSGGEVKFNCVDFRNYVADFNTEFNTINEVPILSSFSDIDGSNDEKKFANWMNYKMLLNLSFEEYYNFAQECPDANGKSVFDLQNAVVWDASLSPKQLDIKAGVHSYLETNGQYLKPFNSTQLIQELNPEITNVNSKLNAANDYLGFGEYDLSYNHNNLYLLEQGPSILDNNLNLFRDVFGTINSELLNLNDIEDEAPTSNYINNCKEITVAGTPVVNFPNLTIDRAFLYSNGVIWVRLANSSDLSYYDDIYFHFDPFNFIYKISDIGQFDNIEPIFDQEELHFVKLFWAGSVLNEIVASRKSKYADAKIIGKVELNDFYDVIKYPFSEQCEDRKYELASIKAKVKYLEYIENEKNKFKMEYQNFCLNQSPTKAITSEKLQMEYSNAEVQFTLYYYDKAGNLVKTVPPEGVDRAFANNYVANYDIPNGEKESIDNYRNNNAGSPVLPQHTKATTYKYNSDNQVIRQRTPNGGESLYWYDKAGRLVLSQNAKQKDLHAFNYTLFDEQSRIVEIGEVELPAYSSFDWVDINNRVVADLADPSITDKKELRDYIEEFTRSGVIKTFYDNSLANVSFPSDFNQENLRSRVVSQAIYSNYNNLTTITEEWDFATHYSYDVTGNVKTILNDYYQRGRLDEVEERFKRIDYLYDVVNGNVIRVYYQLSKPDAFYHEYEYDAENRITNVKTSRDGVIWDNDANYKYYMHGPLARLEIGNQSVQGIDYAYTLQGWLKAVNSGNKAADIGNDFAKSSITATDAFGFGLNYHTDDYVPVTANSNLLFSSNTGSNNSDLYNGNISSLTIHNQQTNIGKKYLYDQLNRIRSMDEANLNSSNMTWQAGGVYSYSSMYDYDRDGNLKTLTRYDGDNAMNMDEFTYNYMAGTDKLMSVDDDVDMASFPNDIDQQISSNYTYDKLGNLIADDAEKIHNIVWNNLGKVKRIVRLNPTKNQPNLEFEYDGFGNRVKKTVKFVDGGLNYFKSTYYVLDAQGNLMASYDERDCQFAGDDEDGYHNYQYSENFAFYTNEAIDQTNQSNVLNFLNGTVYGGVSFARKNELLEQAHLNLANIPNIHSTLWNELDLTDYVNLYPISVQRLLNMDAYFYADYLFNNNKIAFINLMNDKNETWIQYLINNNKIQDFYDNFSSYYLTQNNTQQLELDNIQHVLQMQKQIAGTIIINDPSKFRALFRLNQEMYDEIIDAYDDPSKAADYLTNYFAQLQDFLDNSQDDEEVEALILKINALLILVSDFESGEFESIFDRIDFNTFYNAFGFLSSPRGEILNSVLHHINFIKNTIGANVRINVNSLNSYEATDALDWSVDVNGDYLKYFLLQEFANTHLIDVSGQYFSGVGLTNSNLYFNSSNTVYPYVKQSMLRNYANSIFKSAVLANGVASKDYLLLTENTTQFMYYFKTYEPLRVLELNYDFDDLLMAMNGISLYSPFQYAKNLELLQNVSFTLPLGCDADSAYLVTNSFNIYGSSRLGVMEGKENRRTGDYTFARKLRAKNYELSDHLGNVVATVSDKKMHPQELLVSGNQNIDPNMGYQPDVTGRYDYYPFGMEIMSRSGNFSLVGNSTSTTELIYDGLFEDCADFSTNASEPQICEVVTNLYGQPYINTYRVENNGNNDFENYIYFNVAKYVPAIVSANTYKIEIKLDGVAGIPISSNMGNFTGVVTSAIAGTGTAAQDILASNEKFITFTLLGDQLESMLDANGKVEIEYILEESADPITFVGANLLSVRVYKINQNTTVPFALRDDAAYRYGFNGMERDDELSGSGNSYTTEFRQYDPRLGRWYSIDPKKSLMPWESPYSFSNNSPIAGNDPNGDICIPCIQFVAGFTLDVLEQFAEGYFLEDITSFDKLADNWSFWQSIRSGSGSTINAAGLAGRIATSPMLKMVVSEFIESIAEMVQSAVNSYYKGEEIDVYDLIMEAMVGPAARRVGGALPQVKLKNTKVVENQLGRQNRITSPGSSQGRVDKLNSLQESLDKLNKLNSITTEQIIPDAAKIIYKTTVKSSDLYKHDSSKGGGSTQKKPEEKSEEKPKKKPRKTQKTHYF